MISKPKFAIGQLVRSYGYPSIFGEVLKIRSSLGQPVYLLALNDGEESWVSEGDSVNGLHSAECQNCGADRTDGTQVLSLNRIYFCSEECLENHISAKNKSHNPLSANCWR